MRRLLHTTNLLLGVIFCAFAQAEAHGHLHGYKVRGPSDILPNLKRDTELLRARDSDDSYGRKDRHGGHEDWNGGSYEYKGDGVQGFTLIIDVTEVAVGKHKTTSKKTVETMSDAKSNGQQSGRTTTSFVTTTVFETASAQKVTVTPMPNIITQTQMVTVAASSTHSTTGLAPGAAGATQSMTMGTQSQTVASAMSVKSVPTSILTASTTSVGSAFVGSSGQVVVGTGIINAAGACDCECFCALGSFPSYSSMAASPNTIAATTMKTVASSGATSAMILSSAATAAVSGATSSPSSSTRSPSEPVSTPMPSAMASPSETISSDTAQPNLVTDTANAPAETGSKINVSTLSLKSQLSLGNLAQQATNKP